MAYQIRLTTAAEKELNKLPAKDYKRIQTALVVIKSDHFIGKKLQGKLKNLYSYRVWPYRIIYKIYKTELLIIVIRIGHRQEVYKR